jgi:hypothetical protein
VLVVTRHKKFEELDAPDPILAAMNRTAQSSWENQFSIYVEHRDTYLMRYRGDLSDNPRVQDKAAEK